MNYKEAKVQSFLNFYDRYKRSIKGKSRINIDASYRCPLKCPFCQRQRHEENSISDHKIKISSDITLGTMDKIMDFFPSILFCGQISDPIFHPKFIDILKQIKKRNPQKVGIHTIGMRTADWWRKAYPHTPNNTRWVFGLDGTDQETANIYRVGTNFNMVMNAMRIGRDEFDLDIQWQFIVFKHNEHQVELAHKMAEEYGITLVIYKSARWIYSGFGDIYPPSPEWMIDGSYIGEKLRYYYGKKP